jgi:hypothetical protein
LLHFIIVVMSLQDMLMPWYIPQIYAFSWDWRCFLGRSISLLSTASSIHDDDSHVKIMNECSVIVYSDIMIICWMPTARMIFELQQDGFTNFTQLIRWLLELQCLSRCHTFHGDQV